LSSVATSALTARVYVQTTIQHFGQTISRVVSLAALICWWQVQDPIG
jgi:hypothetical protein